MGSSQRKQNERLRAGTVKFQYSGLCDHVYGKCQIVLRYLAQHMYLDEYTNS